jgi:hypothetical protein
MNRYDGLLKLIQDASKQPTTYPKGVSITGEEFQASLEQVAEQVKKSFTEPLLLRRRLNNT